MTDTDRAPVSPEPGPHSRIGPTDPVAQPPGQSSPPLAGSPGAGPAGQGTAGAGEIADAVLDRIGGKVASDGVSLADKIPAEPDTAAVKQAIALREQAPEMYDLWLKIAKDRAETANYVERAPYEVPERLAQSGRPRALGALVIVLAFCGYLAWLGGPGPYIGGLIAIGDLALMFSMFFGLRPERLPDPQEPDRRRSPPQRRRHF